MIAQLEKNEALVMEMNQFRAVVPPPVRKMSVNGVLFAVTPMSRLVKRTAKAHVSHDDTDNRADAESPSRSTKLVALGEL